MAITANQVTMLRIFLLPAPVYLLIYGDIISWWIAFGIFVLLGATDFIDGMMARREGATKLGSLIDPVADKIFVAALLLSMVAIGMFPAWVISALLTREFLMTALRSSVAQRQAVIKTSMLGKLKTIIQMGGFGTIFLSLVVFEQMPIICMFLSLLFFCFALPYLVKFRRPPFWILPVFFAFVIIAVLTQFFPQEWAMLFQISIIVAITWASALDYMIGSYKLFRKSGMLASDFVRIAWSLIFGLFVAPLVAHFPIMVLPILVSISLEFGQGGIDNVVVLEKKIFSFMPFLLSSICGLIFALLINAVIYFDLALNPFYYAFALALASAVICGATFGRHVDIFTGKHI